MAKITSRASLNVGVELTINETARTFTLVAAGNLVAKDGVTLQALYSKFADLWTTTTYQDSPFPLNAIDALSGQYYFGVDAGGNYNGWKPGSDAIPSPLPQPTPEDVEKLSRTSLWRSPTAVFPTTWVV